MPSTGYVKAYKLLSIAGAYWRGDENRPMLQRIYGTAFMNQQEMCIRDRFEVRWEGKSLSFPAGSTFLDVKDGFGWDDGVLMVQVDCCLLYTSRCV